MRTTDLIFSGFYIATLLVAATQISLLSDTSSTIVSSHLYPWVVIATGLVVGLVETARAALTTPTPHEPTLKQVWQRAFAPRRVFLLGLFIFYLSSITLIGFILATALFCPITIVALAPARSLHTVIVGAAVTAGTLGLIYLLLVVYLEAFLP